LVRENARVRALCGGAWILAGAAFVISFHTDLPRVLSLLPAINISDQIGALILPLGAAALLGWNSAAVAACRWTLTAACITIAFFRWRRHEAAYMSADWNCETPIFLVAGALVFVGAFFVYANIAYRAIFMLLTIPGLQRLAARFGSRDSMARLTLVALPLCLSQAVVAKALAATAPLNMTLRAATALLFILREIAWWWIITTLTTVLIAYVAKSWWVGADRPHRSRQLPADLRG
jgi:hypothetical protein